MVFIIKKPFFYMNQKKLPKSVRKFIRSEKARIRVQILDMKKQQELIGELYKKMLTQPSNSIAQAPKEKTVTKKDDVKEEEKKEKVTSKPKEGKKT